MTKRKKIYLIIISVFIIALIVLFGRNVTFSIECLLAEQSHISTFYENKDKFLELADFFENSSEIDIYILSKDTIYIEFQNNKDYYQLITDSMYSINSTSNTVFSVNKDGCLEKIDHDTIYICQNSWKVEFTGHYENHRIDSLLLYYGWKRKEFNNLVESVQELNCYQFTKVDFGFGLRYKLIPFYNDNILGNRHPDGYFDYLYTNQPDSFEWQNSLKHLEGKFYAIQHWDFIYTY